MAGFFWSATGEWFDPVANTRTALDGTIRPLSATARAWVLARLAEQDTSTDRAQIRDSLAAGVATITAARDQAQNHIAVATAAADSARATQTAAITRAATIRAIPTPTVAQIKEELALVREDQAAMAALMASVLDWAAKVDQNAVTTDNALIGLAKIESETL